MKSKKTTTNKNLPDSSILQKKKKRFYKQMVSLSAVIWLISEDGKAEKLFRQSRMETAEHGIEQHKKGCI